MIAGFARIWRAPTVLWLTVFVHAAVQALLVLPDPQPALTPGFAVLAAVSTLAAVACLAVVTTTALLVVDRPLKLSDGLRESWQRCTRLSIWASALLGALLLGSALWIVPGALVAALTPFVLLAAADGAPAPLRANFHTIRRHPWRWLVMTVLMAGVVAVSWLLASVSGLLIGGAPSAFLTWVWFGFLAIWFQCSWAVTYRREPGARYASDMPEQLPQGRAPSQAAAADPSVR